jgi:hydrogenase maturation protease
VRPRVLVAGIGNIFLGDDGFGVVVAGRLTARLVDHPAPAGVRYADFGIRAVHLAYELLDGYDALVLVDAVPFGAAEGTVTVVDPEVEPPPAPGDLAAELAPDLGPVLDGHALDPASLLGMLAGLRCMPDVVRVVACEPGRVDEGIGLTPAVAAAVDIAVATVDDLVRDLLAALHPNRPTESCA